MLKKYLTILSRARPELPHFRHRTPSRGKVLCVSERLPPSPAPFAANIVSLPRAQAHPSEPPLFPSPFPALSPLS